MNLKDPVEVMARTLWGEARGEPTVGKEAVASVILNRVRKAEANGGKYWWGGNIIEVCRSPYQFSCWNENDPNYQKLVKVSAENDNDFVLCFFVASWACSDQLSDQTYGSTHYHTTRVNPRWARGLEPVVQIGNHLFYNNVR